MKKFMRLLVVIMLVAFSSQITSAQSRESCVKHDATRTMEEFKQVVLTWKDPFISSQLWPEYARRANAILQTSKIKEVREFVVTPDLKGMTLLMQYSFRHERSHFLQSDYNNGVRVNNKLIYPAVAIEGQPSDWVVLEFQDVSGVYAKIACCNPQDPKIPVVAYTPPAPAPAPVPQTKVDTVKVVYITEYREAQPQMVPQQPIQYGYRESRVSVNVGIGRPMYYPQPRMQMRQPMVYHQPVRQYCPPQRQYRPQPRPPRPTYEPRTMPGGIPSIPTYQEPNYNPGSGGGLPSSPRGMPGGIQGRSMARF